MTIFKRVAFSHPFFVNKIAFHLSHAPVIIRIYPLMVAHRTMRAEKQMIQNMIMPTDIVILAAGKGTRMKSQHPKVLHHLAGKPLLQHVVDAARTIDDARMIVVTGHGSEQVRSVVVGSDLTYVEQAEQHGTAHAVQQAVPALRNNSVVLILYGDVPLISPQTIKNMLNAVDENSIALLTVKLADPTGYGRIIRDSQGQVAAIVEQKDALPDQLKINEVNTGVLALGGSQLNEWLPKIGNNNAQGEYYLTDIIAIAREAGFCVATCSPLSEQEVEGVNNRQQLGDLERYYQREQARQLMAEGNTLADPSRIDVRGSLKTGTDNYIDVNCVFVGQVTIGSNITIGPNCMIVNSSIADGAEIKANSVVEETEVGPKTSVGPFARLRPGTVLAEGAKVGNFVETKKAVVGKGSKINHLSYVGDAELGEGVNVGAGTITCNYDGVNKSRTEIGDKAFIGSNTSLVAPVKIGAGATIGAGSTINQDVSGEQLAVARAKQQNISGWSRPEKKS